MKSLAITLPMYNCRLCFLVNLDSGANSMETLPRE